MPRLPDVVGGAWDFVLIHPFITAWLAATSAWMLFAAARRER
ncbi:MAG TPA: hypothetical protein VLI41_06305 [Phenylobacterium sp.]|nr:hypothetical protein [Phenylobacterium sp.]HSV02801.1 hypothetical protein [Phenylobacterium sp.]